MKSFSLTALIGRFPQRAFLVLPRVDDTALHPARQKRGAPQAGSRTAPSHASAGHPCDAARRSLEITSHKNATQVGHRNPAGQLWRIARATPGLSALELAVWILISVSALTVVAYGFLRLAP